MTGEEKNLLTEAQGFETKFDEAMDDDLTPQMHWQLFSSW